MSKEGCFFGLGQEGGCLCGGGGTVWNTLKGGGIAKSGTKDFKRGQTGSRGWCLKKGAGTSLKTMQVNNFTK